MSIEKKALIIIDMVKDYFVTENNYSITPFATKIISPINRLIDKFRQNQFPVIFATDAFKEDDFIFQGKMHPHAIKGTKGAEVIDELKIKTEDLWLQKPRFSAFFDTDLEKIMKKQGVTMCAVAGIATNFCVLTTAMDALCYDFKTVILEDCSAAFSQEIHENCLSLYQNSPLYPLLRVMNSSDFAKELN